MFKKLLLACLLLLEPLIGVAQADYRETVPILRIGLVQTHNAILDPFKIEAIERAFARQLDIPVEIITMPSYTALIDAQASGRIGYAIHSARSFAATQLGCRCVTALRKPIGSDGSIGFRSVLVVRESVNKPVQELKIGYSTKKSVSGWQIPQGAIRSGSLETPRLKQLGNVASLIKAYRTGAIDGFFGWLPDIPGNSGSGLTHLFGGADQLENADPLRILWSSQTIPYGPHAVLNSLPQDLDAALGEFLDDMKISHPGLFDAFEPVHGGGFATPGPDDYRSVENLIETQP